MAAQTPGQLRRIKDPIARLTASREAAAQTRAHCDEAQQAYSQVIAEAIQELLAGGCSLADVADLLGLSRQRVHRMAKPGSRTVPPNS